MLNHAIKDIHYHDDIAGDYDRTVVEPRIVTNDAVYAKLSRLIANGDTMLDLGCGTGHLTGRLSKRFQKVIAVDHSEGMLNKAKSNVAPLRHKHIELVLSDALSFLGDCDDEQFNFVGCVGFLHHLQAEEIVVTLRQLYRLLKPRGQALFQEPIRIDASRIPPAISNWNAKSVVIGMKYCHTAPPPDEAPLEESLFTTWLSDAGFVINKSFRNWEIFPHRLPPSLKDKAYIGLMNYLYGRNGNVYSVVCYKPQP